MKFKNPLLPVLISLLAAGGLAALLQQPRHETAEQSTTSSDEHMKNSREKLGAKQSADDGANDSREARAQRASSPLVDDAPTSLTIEQARDSRLPLVPARKDVAEGGVDALMGAYECKAPYVEVTEARVGEGSLGCGAEDNQGNVVRLGRWVHRSAQKGLTAGSYSHGKPDGLWETYSPEGALLERGNYESGERLGAWDTYDAEGVHLARRRYKGGAFDGISVLYHRQEPTIEVWRDGKLVESKSGFEKTAQEDSGSQKMGIDG